jgi:hypothetical protein
MRTVWHPATRADLWGDRAEAFAKAGQARRANPTGFAPRI